MTGNLIRDVMGCRSCFIEPGFLVGINVEELTEPLDRICILGLSFHNSCRSSLRSRCSNPCGQPDHLRHSRSMLPWR